MNSKRTYLDSLNAGRQRRSYATLEQLNRSLETLEQRIERNREEDTRQPPAAQAERFQPARDTAPKPSHPAYSDDRQSGGDRYGSIARGMEKVRDQEDQLAAFGTIAGELRGLRDELRHQVTTGLRREFDALRGELERSRAAGAGKAAGQLGVEFDRLSDAIEALAQRSDDKTINQMRLEIEQLRSAMTSVAREDTMLSVDRRLDAFDVRLGRFEDRIVNQPASREPADFTPIVKRLEEIGTAVGSLPDSVSLRSLDEKVRMLATAFDHLASQQGGRTTETLTQIGDRLDEISRALVATTVAAQTPHHDPEPFQRIEARITALARQIEEVAQPNPSPEVVQRLDALSGRVDDLAARSDRPEKAIEQLARQVSSIADKVEKAAPAADPQQILSGIDMRFDALSSLIERRQEDSREQGDLMFRELERRIDEVADKVERRDPALASGALGALDARISALTQSLEGGRGSVLSDQTLQSLEARLEGISERLDASASHISAIDPDLIRNLELQVASLSAHLTQPNAPLPELEDIQPRLSEIERAIAENRQSLLEAARTAAADAVSAIAAAPAGSPAVADLAQDVKALEALTRRSDERNGKTFEAIHDTLLKIVDRLASLETETVAALTRPQVQPQHKAPFHDLEFAQVPSHPAPTPSAKSDHLELSDLSAEIDASVKPRTSVERSPAQAAAAAAVAALDSDHVDEIKATTSKKRSLLGGLSGLFSGKKETPPADTTAKAEPALPAVAAAPAVSLDAPLDPKLANRPLEPGSGAPDLNAIMKRVRDERGQPVKHSETDTAKSDFIAAARRAAQAAAAEAEVLKRKSDLGPVRALRLGDIIKTKRKPILMAATALMTALAGLQVGKSFMSDPVKTASHAPAKQAETTKVAKAADTAKPKAKVETGDVMAAAPRAVDPKPDAATASDAAVAATPMAMPATGEQTASTLAEEAATQEPAGIPPLPAMPAEQVASVQPGDVQISVLPATSEAAPATPVSLIEVPADAGPLPLREAASGGDAKALFEVATRYAEGRGLKPDLETAAKWYEKAAELGLAPAQYRIGSFYEKGTGVARDIAKSKMWYEKAAEAGNASAMHNLAVLNAMGADGATDNEAAARWFVKAAEFGVRDSQFNLGILTAKGVGMPQNLEESYKWFALVAKSGDKDAAGKRDEIAAALRPEQLERARAAAELWKPKPLNQEANNVDIPDAWTEGTEKTASVDMKKAVKNIQLILNKNGYDAGGADGVMGGKTKSAIAAFQRDNGMDATGEVDEKLVEALLKRK